VPITESDWYFFNCEPMPLCRYKGFNNPLETFASREICNNFCAFSGINPKIASVLMDRITKKDPAENISNEAY